MLSLVGKLIGAHLTYRQLFAQGTHVGVARRITHAQLIYLHKHAKCAVGQINCYQICNWSVDLAGSAGLFL